MEPERRSARQGADGAAAAVRPGHRSDDRKTEAGAAALPRACPIRPGPAVEDPRQRFGGYSGAGVRDLDHYAARSVRMRRQLDGVARVRVLERVLEQRVERVSQPLWIGEQAPCEADVEPPGARRHLRPANEEVGQERLEVDLLEDDPQLLRLREQQQPPDTPLPAREI